MPKKPAKSAKTAKPKKTYVNLYELLVTFSGREQQLVQHVEEKDRARLLQALGDSREAHGFYELGGHRGHECVINTAHLARLNVLGYLPGVQFEAEPEEDQEDAFRQLEERESDETPVILRLWIRGETGPHLQHGVEYAAWVGVRHDLIERSKFIEFEDEDGEDVLYGVDHLDAVEAIDPFYLNEEQVKTLLTRYDDEKDEPTPPASASASN